MGKELDVTTDERRVRPGASEVMRLISNNKKAQRLMGWRPQVNLDEGLRRTIDYMAVHLQDYKPNRYNV